MNTALITLITMITRLTGAVAAVPLQHGLLDCLLQGAMQNTAVTHKAGSKNGWLNHATTPVRVHRPRSLRLMKAMNAGWRSHNARAERHQPNTPLHDVQDRGVGRFVLVTLAGEGGTAASGFVVVNDCHYRY